MKVRNLRKIVTIVLVVCSVFWGCTGCTKEPADDLQMLELEEGTQESEDPASKQAEKNSLDTQEKNYDEAERKEAVSQTVFVYVCGAVMCPGVYELESGARVYEAVEKAGGVREDAAAEAVNQARSLSDGEQIYIPTEEEWKANPEGYKMLEKSSDAEVSGKVDINTATAEELVTLSGIGDARAQSILAYREQNGPFQSIEELMNVEGIKEGIFARIKDRIIVNAGS